jgi:hypothetical protein
MKTFEQIAVRTARALLAALLISVPGQGRCDAGEAAAGKGGDYQLFARTNLMAWCIVPFDGKKRGPEERAAMLENLGLKLFAYDFRPEHIPTFDAEIEALKRHNVRLVAWWFPSTMADAQRILEVLERHQVRDVQLWIMGTGKAPASEAEQDVHVKSEAAHIRPIAEAAAKQGYKVALYNHGSWFGEPENQIAIIESLRKQGLTNIGIVYNQHHGHEHIDRFPALLQTMKPYLLALNLNGMTKDGDKIGKKILPIGEGDLDSKLLRIIEESGWRGPIGILNHTQEDAEVRLRQNMEGLERVVGAWRR